MPHPDAGTFDFLATMTLLGSQPISPVVLVDSQESSLQDHTSSGTGLGLLLLSPTTNPRKRTKSYSNVNRTNSERHGHRRSTSFGSVLKRAKTTAATAFSIQEECHDGRRRDPTWLEDVWKSNRTKAICLSDGLQTVYVF
jgi:hypothetical protein